MQTYESLKHTTWECKYHVVFIPKCRRKVLYQQLRRELGEVFRSLAEQWECKVEGGHLMPDHVHMLLSVPPKYSVSNVTEKDTFDYLVKLARALHTDLDPQYVVTQKGSKVKVWFPGSLAVKDRRKKTAAISRIWQKIAG